MTAVAAALATSAPAFAQHHWGGHWGHGHWGHGGWGWGGAAIGGFAAGALLGSALAAPGYYYAPGYYDDPGYYGAPDAEVYGEGPADPNAEAYCARRYRSYDPASGTFLGYDGARHPCP
jgi:hypothetical protein